MLMPNLRRQNIYTKKYSTYWNMSAFCTVYLTRRILLWRCSGPTSKYHREIFRSSVLLIRSVWENSVVLIISFGTWKKLVLLESMSLWKFSVVSVLCIWYSINSWLCSVVVRFGKRKMNFNFLVQFRKVVDWALQNYFICF